MNNELMNIETPGPLSELKRNFLIRPTAPPCEVDCPRKIECPYFEQAQRESRCLAYLDLVVGVAAEIRNTVPDAEVKLALIRTAAELIGEDWIIGKSLEKHGILLKQTTMSGDVVFQIQPVQEHRLKLKKELTSVLKVLGIDKIDVAKMKKDNWGEAVKEVTEYTEQQRKEASE